MAKNQQLPFPYIHGLTPRQQREIYRDFQSITTDPDQPVTSRGVRVYLDTNQSIADGSTTQVSWDAEDFDTDDFWFASSPDKIVVPSDLDGLYLITLGIDWAFESSTSSRRACNVQQNGTLLRGNSIPCVTDTGLDTVQGLSIVANLVATDEITGHVRQDSGTTVELNTAGGSTTNSLSIVRLGSAL